MPIELGDAYLARVRYGDSASNCNSNSNSKNHDPWTQPNQRLNRPLFITRACEYEKIQHPTSTILSGAPCQNVETEHMRSELLSEHILAQTRGSTGAAEPAHKNMFTWDGNPFIHCTSRPFEVRCRVRDWSQKTVTVINPNVRRAVQLPTLSLGDELESRSLGRPASNYEFVGEYLCLWEVTPDEIVGHWRATDLVGLHAWYTRAVMPAFREHDERYFAAHPERQESRVARVSSWRRADSPSDVLERPKYGDSDTEGKVSD
ncbi:hypothetical protein BO70DRAFT_433225 [Aspergillus heteromorphus CBS 117.55]|uniref:Uncharacterized protein n=1 Tax=Aspergillus heteromorphus CBS 117.55 TaxID=1448321 RepID=A0A317UXF8_9EURO|nr:uncharacterized protein BO70DRAFT_433225 [Aspergillus heteromorphus CBS 117.55]PWY65971.1 hypothetical protein BO70DRAFT_433225 [Aspergillus heteromorphus CBS 117.55]